MIVKVIYLIFSILLCIKIKELIFFLFFFLSFFKDSLTQDKKLLVLLNGVPLGNKIPLAVRLAEPLGSKVYLEPQTWQMFQALRAAEYPEYNTPRYEMTMTNNPTQACVHLLELNSLNSVANISSTVENVLNGAHPRPDGVELTVCFQTMAFCRVSNRFWRGNNKVLCEPTSFSDHSTQKQLQNFCTALMEMGFAKENVFLLSLYGADNAAALSQIWPRS